jgi:hypothetical protein
MSSTASWRIFSSTLLFVLAGCAMQPRVAPPLYSDDFANLEQWIIEAEQPAQIVATEGTLDIDAPAGVTLWFRPRLSGPVEIEFEATAVSAGGVNDQVSDLNVFWMANNRDGVEPVYARPRSGAFAEYDDLVTYYAGVGGNRNTTTRFRRYIGEPGNRPLLVQHDLRDRSAMLVPNRREVIRLIADGTRIEYQRNGQPLFHLTDAAPYRSGWFALRTTFSHLRIRALRIHRPIH